MSEARKYPKRLIEIDLPIRRISEHSRREKSIRHGHISTLHIWWARRPLGACRAVLCAALWPDPADQFCPDAFRVSAYEALAKLSAGIERDRPAFEIVGRHASIWRGFQQGSVRLDAGDGLMRLRDALLLFIGEFSSWNAATVPLLLETARRITRAAHTSLHGAHADLPSVLDPFAGGGSIPLEALRVGADAIASDINPIPVLLNRVVLEFGSDRLTTLRDTFASAARQVEERTRKFLAPAFETRAGAAPVAYLWARTILCEGPACGLEIPMLRTLRLSKHGKASSWLRLTHDEKERALVITVEQRESSTGAGTVKSGSVLCPACGYTTKGEAARAQLAARNGGSADARMVAVLERDTSGVKRFRAPEQVDARAHQAAVKLLDQLRADAGGLSTVPDELIPTERPSPNARGLSAVTRVGMRRFGDLYTPRQALVLAALAKAVREVTEVYRASATADADILNVLLAAAVSKRADFGSSLCSWRLGASCVRGTFARQALANTWDFGEMYPFAGSAGDWAEACAFIDKFLGHLVDSKLATGSVISASATHHPLPDDTVDALITDPPYYDSVPYADLSDYFYVWLRRALTGRNSLPGAGSPKDGEIIWNPTRSVGQRPKDKQFYEEQMTLAFQEARRVTKPDGIAVVVFAHKSTAGWEAVLEALLKAGWIATGSWPLDTERAGRTNAVGTASLGSSVHIVCRPRESASGAVVEGEVGSWRDVLQELPQRIHEWMPRLSQEGIVGADAIFACLGPALEVFSRFSRVEKSNGDVVGLRDYLEHVWAAVSREALSMIFSAADASGLEADARITAIWLWTLADPTDSGAKSEAGDSDEDDEVDDDGDGAEAAGFVLDFDAARKIAQGLGARLEELEAVVEVQKDKARLLPVAERSKFLFGKSVGGPSAKRPGKKKQMTLFAEIDEAAEAQGWGEVGAPRAGTTTLDRVHQAMLLFGAGRGEALKRFIVEEGVGKQPQFWKLAQSLSALYPIGTDEKRWVDGFLARKKGLGFG
ncbi:MAG: DUF1156 domain-containing protein [Deltaproteobacteria bacterium]|nr:DUF1156 domain-containing protein [Deltaproteobacteria bacterium]